MVGIKGIVLRISGMSKDMKINCSIGLISKALLALHCESSIIIEPLHKKTKKKNAWAITKAQISFAVTAKLISAFVFAARIIQSFFFFKSEISSF